MYKSYEQKHTYGGFLATSDSRYNMHRLKLRKLEGKNINLRESNVWEAAGELSQSRGDRHRDMDNLISALLELASFFFLKKFQIEYLLI